MTRIKQAGPPVLVIALITGIIGYILGCTQSKRENAAQANVAQQQSNSEDTQATSKTPAQPNATGAATIVKPDPRKTYYPNTEELGENEMRVISLGTGMPNQRKSQASACWLVELGNVRRQPFGVGNTV